jgi:type I restriction enzyme S subunit
MPEAVIWSFGELAKKGFLEFGDGYRTKQSELGKPGLPILRVAEVLDGRIRPGFTDYVHNDYRYAMGNKISQPGDVVLTTKGTIGRVALIPKEAPTFTYSPQVCFFRTSPDSPLLSHYLYYWLKGPGFVNQSAAVKSQTDMADYINLADIRALNIKVPPINTQRAIIEILGTLDYKITSNEQLTSTTWSLAKAYFDQSYGESDPWCEFTIRDIADIYDGPHATPIKTSNGPWFLSVSSLRSGFLDLAASAHLSESDFIRWTRRVTPRAGDILFSYETRLGEAAIMPGNVEGCLGRRMALMRVKDNSIGSTLLLLAYLSKSFQERIRIGAVHGATVDRIPLVEFASWKIALPAAEARNQLNNTLKVLYDRAVRSMHESYLIGDLRDTLIPGLISGELRVRDAERVVKDAV